MPQWVKFDYRNRAPIKGERFNIGHLNRDQRNSKGDMTMKGNYVWKDVRFFAKVESGNYNDISKSSVNISATSLLHHVA